MSIDPHDDLIEALVTARERGLERVECKTILRDVFNAPREFEVSPPRIMTCVQPTHETSSDAAGSSGLKFATVSDVSAKPTKEGVPPADQQAVGGYATSSPSREKAARPVPETGRRPCSNREAVS
jgi:hypothetical protein